MQDPGSGIRRRASSEKPALNPDLRNDGPPKRQSVKDMIRAFDAPQTDSNAGAQAQPPMVRRSQSSFGTAIAPEDYNLDEKHASARSSKAESPLLRLRSKYTNRQQFETRQLAGD
jgi:hypothetical protein